MRVRDLIETLKFINDDFTLDSEIYLFIQGEGGDEMSMIPVSHMGFGKGKDCKRFVIMTDTSIQEVQ